MARSAPYAIKNATVVFYVAGPALETDARTGNVSAVDQNLSYDIYYEEIDDRSSELPGADLNRKILDCYLVSPAVLDSRIITGTECTVTLEAGRTFNGKVRNTKYPFGNQGTLGATLTKVLGDTVLIELHWGS